MKKQEEKRFDVDLIEKLADIEHERWSNWQRYIMTDSFEFIKTVKGLAFFSIKKEWWDGWLRQINTKYKDLSESEKKSDIKEVEKYLPLIKNWITEHDKRMKDEVIEERKEYIEKLKQPINKNKK